VSNFEATRAFWLSVPRSIHRYDEAFAWLDAAHAARLLERLKKMPGTNMDLKREIARKLRERIRAVP